MKNNKLFTVNELKSGIESGKKYFVAGDENLLKKLPKGDWIGGTIPYFMADKGGVITAEQIFATELPSYVQSVKIKSYNEQTIKNVYTEAPENGFSMIIIPAMSKIHSAFASQSPEYANFASRPLVGWISGTHLNDFGKITPKVFNGSTGEVSDSNAIVMQVALPSNYVADMGIINIFTPGDGDTLEFPETGFNVTDVMVNGTKTNFADYCAKHNLDVKLPLVANYAGAMINVSIQNVDAKSKQVSLYAPVFKGIKYKQAKKMDDYVKSFTKELPKDSEQILFSCNCILNFLYSELEGKQTAGVVGPVTFGEVAYQLLNQTMVYLNIQKI